MAVGRGAGGIWKTLGIPRTRDRNEIRRAYARQLKITNPEDDPEGFKTLRAAYEQALAQAAMPESFYAVSHFEVLQVEEVEALVTVETADLAKTDQVPPLPEPPLVFRPEPEPEPEPEPQPGPEAEAKPAPETALVSGPEPEVQPRPTFDVRPSSKAETRPLPSPPPPPPSAPSPMAGLQQTLGGLEALLRRKDGDSAVIMATFKALLASPIMDNIGVHTAAETQVAQLINRYAPQSDVLLSPAIGYFHWDHAGFQIRTSPAVLHVLRRNAAMPILKRLRTKGDVYHPAYLILSAPPKPVTWLNRLTGPTPEAVQDLLRRIRQKHPVLLNDLNTETVAAYDAYYAVPRLKAWGVWTCGLALLCLVIAPIGWLVIPPTMWPVMTLFLPPLAAALVAVTQLYAFAWPRHLWEEAGSRAPPWLKWGWAGTAFAALVLAACPPWWPVTVLVLLLSALTLPWAAATGEPDQTPGQFPWQVRIMLGNPLLLAWWLVTVWSFPFGTGVQMTAALAAFAFSPGMAKLSLYRAWMAAPKRLRMAVPAALFALSVAAMALLFYSQVVPDLKTWAFAAIAAIVVANRAPWPITWRFRFTWRFLWIGAIIATHGFGAGILLFSWVFMAGGITLLWNMINMIGQFNDARKLADARP